jgi:hypothetical protein
MDDPIAFDSYVSRPRTALPRGPAALATTRPVRDIVPMMLH